MAIEFIHSKFKKDAVDAHQLPTIVCWDESNNMEPYLHWKFNQQEGKLRSVSSDRQRFNVVAQPPTLSKSTNFYIGRPLIIQDHPILPCRVAWPDADTAEHFVDVKIGIETVGLLTQGIDQIERHVSQSLRSRRCSASSSRNIPLLSTTPNFLQRLL